MNLERTDWVRALTAHPAPLLNALATKLTAECEVKLTSPGQIRRAARASELSRGDR